MSGAQRVEYYNCKSTYNVQYMDSRWEANGKRGIKKFWRVEKG